MGRHLLGMVHLAEDVASEVKMLGGEGMGWC
jgi:hypothetical protein